VTVDQAGRVTIPAVVTGTVRAQPVGLERVTRQATTGAADAVPVQVATRSQDAAPPRADAESRLYVDLPGLVETLAVPGFEDAPVAIAVLEDGTQLVLNRAADGSTRVAGTYSGTFPRVQVDGEWAVTAAPGRCTVLRRNPGGAGGQ
jgi:hypothetical protein